MRGLRLPLDLNTLLYAYDLRSSYPSCYLQSPVIVEVEVRAGGGGGGWG